MNFDEQYPLTNDRYQPPNTTIDFMVVPWTSRYTDVVDFPNLSSQLTEMNSLVKKTVSSVNYIKKDNAFKFSGNVALFEGYNYLRYKNANYNNKYFYCFIDKIEYLTKNTTLIYITTDVWQTWQFDLTYYDSFIERSHVSKSDDSYKLWTNPEPIQFPAEYEKQTNMFSIDWGFSWVATCLSRVARDSTDYKYGGIGVGEDYYGAYGFSTGGGGASEVLLDRYYKGDEAVDHRSDIVSLNAVPNWVLMGTLQDVGLTSDGYLNGNPEITENNTVNVSFTSLPNGYTPRNKKMLGSNYRVFVLYNKNGFKYPIKPELITGASLNVTMKMRPLNANGIKCQINNYDKVTDSFFTIPYSCSSIISYNENSGLQQEIAKAKAIGNDISTGLNVIGGVASIFTGNIAGGVSALAGSVSSVADNILQTKSAYEKVTASIGNMGDCTNITSEYIQLRLADTCPLYSECVIVDKFLDTYGYNVSEIGYLPNWFTNRNSYNYIKTNNCKISIDGCQGDLQPILDMFNNGVTVWHSISGFGDYNVSNT